MNISPISHPCLRPCAAFLLLNLITASAETHSPAVNPGTPLDGRDVTASDTGTLTITDDDTATFTIDDVTVDEAAGTATFTVSTDKPIDTNVVVDVSYADITAVIDCVTNGTCELWQCDIDRSGSCAPSDILREIDVRNGADQFDMWDGTPLPSAAGICP